MSVGRELNPELYFNIANGEQYIGADALDAAIEEGVHPADIQPLPEALLDTNVILQKENYTRPWRPKVSREELIVYGKWISGIVKAGNPKGWTTDDILERAYTMGLGPGPRLISRRFEGTLWRFRDEVGEKGGWAHTKYAEWTTRDYIEYGKRIVKGRHGKKPTIQDFHRAFKAGKGPAPSFIHSHVGISRLQELLGFPDTSTWTEEDYIAYGVRVMEANPGVDITARQFDELSQRKRGVSAKAISNRFDGKISKFKEVVSEAYEQEQVIRELTLAQKTAQYEKMIAKVELPSELREQTDSDERFVIAAGKFRIIDTLAHDLPISKKLEHALGTTDIWIDTLGADHATITPGRVERLALQMDIFDDLWPLNDHLSYLKLRPKIRKKPERKLPEATESGMQTYLNIQTGQLIIGPEAYDQALEAGDNPSDLQPLGELLASPIESLDFRGKTRKEHYHGWSLEENAVYGKWIAGLVECPDGLPSRDLFRHAHKLDLGPGEGRINTLFGTYGEFQRLAFYEQGDIENWGTEHLLDHLHHIEKAIHGRPTAQDIDRWASHGVGPTYQEITDSYGDITRFYELLGYVDNTNTWDKDNFIAWGISVMDSLNETPLTAQVQKELTRAGKGPKRTEINRVFGNWETFKTHLQQAYLEHCEARNELIENQASNIRELIEAEELPPRFKKLIMKKSEELVRIAANYSLILDLGIEGPPDKKVEIAEVTARNFLRTVTSNTKLTGIQIETIAREKGLYEFIWPHHSYARLS